MPESAQRWNTSTLTLDQAPSQGIDPLRSRSRISAAWARGISLCPASAETFHARPGLAFVASHDVPHTLLSVASRTRDANPAVARFVEIAMATARGGGNR